MKQIKYIFAFITAILAFASCELQSEDIFSTKPVAPELQNSSDIIMTSNTMSEAVNFTWSKARNIRDEKFLNPSYDVVAIYGDANASLGTTIDEYISFSKTEFKKLIYSKFNLPANNSFSMSFKVIASGYIEGEPISIESTVKTLNIYAFGDAVSPVVTPAFESLVLDKADPTGNVDMITWTPARLGYEEEIKYNVYLKYVPAVIEGASIQEEVSDLYQVGTDLTNHSFSMTVDALNEAAIAAGAPEGAESQIAIIVKAFSASVEEGIPSADVVVAITTYIATFPDFMYTPGGHQGWSPATSQKIPQSSTTKGLYEAILDLRGDGSAAEVEWKFSPNPEWKDDFSIDNIEITQFGSGNWTAVSGSGTCGTNIKVPAGVYNVVLNKKLNTLQMFQVESMGVIGDAVGGWDADHDMEWDQEAQTYSVVVNMVTGKEFKFRVNDDWTWSYGGENNVVSSTTGQNLVYNGPEGEYKMVLNVGTNPYSLSFINTSFPEKLWTPGNHQGWSPATSTILEGNGQGYYSGFVNLDGEFKFTGQPDWNPLNWGGSFDALVPDGGNLKVDKGFYFLKVMLNELKAEAILLNSLGLVGTINGWGGTPDIAMTLNADGLWEAKGVTITTADEWKFRFNSDWGVNLGGDLSNLTLDGANIKVSEDGIYDIVLDLTKRPYAATLTKK